jgi:hypothetical protein
MGWNYVSELWPPTCLLSIPQLIYEYGEHSGMILTRKKPKNLEKTRPSATLSTTKAFLILALVRCERWALHTRRAQNTHWQGGETICSHGVKRKSCPCEECKQQLTTLLTKLSDIICIKTQYGLLWCFQTMHSWRDYLNMHRYEAKRSGIQYNMHNNWYKEFLVPVTMQDGKTFCTRAQKVLCSEDGFMRLWYNMQ